MTNIGRSKHPLHSKDSGSIGLFLQYFPLRPPTNLAIVMSTSDPPEAPKPLTSIPIYWSAGTLLVSIHVAAAVGVYYHPFHETCRATLLLAFVLWQAACFG